MAQQFLEMAQQVRKMAQELLEMTRELLEMPKQVRKIVREFWNTPGKLGDSPQKLVNMARASGTARADLGTILHNWGSRSGNWALYILRPGGSVGEPAHVDARPTFCDFCTFWRQTKSVFIRVIRGLKFGARFSEFGDRRLK